MILKEKYNNTSDQ